VIWSTHLGSFEPDYDADNPILRASQPLDEQANLTEAFTREAEGFITRHKSQPFFLYLAYSAVHSPLQGSDAWMKKFAHIPDVQRRIFAAMLGQLDEGVGRVVSRLRAEGLEQRTLIVFLSDNGGPTRELTASNQPLRGEKGQLLEGGIRVPLIVRWPGQLRSGKADRRLVSALDLMPTALDAAGIKPPAALDGASLLPHLQHDSTNPIRAAHYWRVGNRAAYRVGDWKIYRPSAGAPWQLYDVRSDLGEMHDMAAAQPARVAAMEAEWNGLDGQMAAPLWGGPARRRP
jgi:arylsulfatase B